MDEDRKNKPSASGMDRIVKCPGSFLAEQGMPDDRGAFTQKMADDGNRIHELMELNDNAWHGDNPTHEEIADRLAKIEAMLVMEWGETEYTQIREKRLWIGDMVSARCDVVYINHNATKALCIDYKSGWISVSASGSWQLKTQAAVIFSNYTTWMGGAASLQEVTVAIAQARLGVRYEKHVITREQNQINKTRILASVYEALQLNARRFAGEQCGFCRARSECPQATSLAMSVLDGSNDALDRPRTYAALHLARKPILQILDAARAKLMGMTDVELAELGLAKKPGYPVNEYDLHGSYKILMESGLINGPEFRECCDINNGKLEAVVAPRLADINRATQAEGKKILKKILLPVTTKKERAASIVKLEERKAIEA